MHKVTDIHMHIIPGVDDGSASMEESLEEIRMAAAQGVSAIFATPHSWAIGDNTAQVRERFRLLREETARNNIPVRLYLGCEVLCFAHDIEITVRKVKEGIYPTMGGTRYVLIEFDSSECTEEEAVACIDRFTEAGYIPIIAHTERYGFTTAENAARMKAHGARIQINAYSVVNDPKDRTRSLANALLREGLADFVGTDAHRLSHRPPILKEGTEAIVRCYKTEYVEKILMKNAEDLLMGNKREVLSSRIWMDGVMGVVTGDALGCPVQFWTREEVKARPVKTMRGHGTFNLPEGSWTDDSSMTLALLSSIREKQTIDLKDIMERFSDWLENGKYTPFGYSYDIGGCTMDAVHAYEIWGDVRTCGGTGSRDNGNGSLMRILPACLYAYEQKLDDDEAVRIIHEVSGLTHNHLRAKMACGLYYFCVCAVLDGTGSLNERLQQGMDRGFDFYKKDVLNLTELSCYGRLHNLEELAEAPEELIKSSGYVVDSIEAAIWSLITTGSFEECELKAVNLGGDTDTIGAIAGGLAGLYYKYESIPEKWLDAIQRREWIEGLCAVRETENAE